MPYKRKLTKRSVTRCFIVRAPNINKNDGIENISTTGISVLNIFITISVTFDLLMSTFS
jgi:hypothetical protein